MKKIACLGPSGSYSALVAMREYSEEDILLCADFAGVISSVTGGGAESAIIPIENSIRGGVLQNLDLLEVTDVYAVKEYTQKIDHRLALLKGVKPQDVKRIYSHEQAIGQCAKYLHANFPNVQYICTDSTAKSLELLDEHSAGIVGSHIVRENILLSEENIADEKNNFTRFLKLIPRSCGLPEKSDKIFFCAVTKHRPGSLLELLTVLKEFNLTKIESRPIKNVFGEYRFFIELVGNVGDERLQKAIANAEQICRQFRMIGAY